MRAAAAAVVRSRPDALVVISPHSPRRPGAFGVWTESQIAGTFDQFGAPDTAVSLPNDRTLAKAIRNEMSRRDLESWEIRGHPLDHGAMVPLWFLAAAGWTGKAVLIGLNYPGERGLRELGEAIAAAAIAAKIRVAVIASGDMSHRLKHGAPCGYDPQAHRFDDELMRLVRAGEFRAVEKIAPELRELAAEDAADSVIIAASAAGWRNGGHKVLS